MTFATSREMLRGQAIRDNADVRVVNCRFYALHAEVRAACGEFPVRRGTPFD